MSTRPSLIKLFSAKDKEFSNRQKKSFLNILDAKHSKKNISLTSKLQLYKPLLN